MNSRASRLLGTLASALAQVETLGIDGEQQ